MSMIERIARAIDDTYDVDERGEMLNLPDVARAVLEAMQEPTPGMVEAAKNRPVSDDDYDYAGIFAVMITAAKDGK